MEEEEDGPLRGCRRGTAKVSYLVSKGEGAKTLSLGEKAPLLIPEFDLGSREKRIQLHPQPILQKKIAIFHRPSISVGGIRLPLYSGQTSERPHLSFYFLKKATNAFPYN